MVKVVGEFHLAKYPRKVATSQESGIVLESPYLRPTSINVPII